VTLSNVQWLLVSVTYIISSLGWFTGKPLAPLPNREQSELHSHKVGREGDGLSSNRPELVVLRECLDSTETHQDHENLLYLTDSDTSLQVINKWIGGGTKLDSEVLRAIILKLQRRVK